MKLREIADEIDENWPDDFDKEKFVEWSGQIRDAVLSTGAVGLSEFIEYDEAPDGKYVIYILEDPEEEELHDAHKARVGEIVNAIRKTPFWKERKEYAQAN